ncbi:MAG: DNA primase [Candidatus Marinimicrobia bacterium]|nr:DNA primase [Candidatus Neomarinimicrobiota bacterium]
MALIPEHTIEQVREANDVVEVISDYVQLKRSGRNWFGRCPFHNEKTPSFSVSSDKQIYHCFGCGVGGNVINFIMEHERLDFISSVKLLADRVNITIELDQREPQKKDDRASIYNMHEIACRAFERQLADPAGAAAKDYLLKRGLSEDIIKTFRVGFAPDRWDTVTLEVMKMGLSQEILSKSGLLMTKDSGGYYDRFRQRIMFPIADINGKVQAFGGRIFGDGEGAKYMNSPETPIYHKGRTLFGLDQSRDEIRNSRTAILVEGYMDLIRLYQQGFKYVVAGTGTAFTREQAGLIKRFADKVFVCYDGDNAGQKAAQKAGLTLLDKGLDVAIIELPGGEDPDSFFDERDNKAFENLLSSATDFMTFVLSSNQGQMGSPVKRTAFLESIVSELALMQNEILRGMLAGQLAEEMHVPEDAVMGLLEKQSRRSRRPDYNPQPQRVERTTSQNLKRPETGPEMAEFALLRLHLSANKDIVDWLLSSISEEEVGIMRYKELFFLLRNRIHKEFPINQSSIMDEIIEPDMRRFLARLIVRAEAEPDSLDDAVANLRTIRKGRIQVEMDKLKTQIREAEAAGIDSIELLKKKVELQLKKASL